MAKDKTNGKPIPPNNLTELRERGKKNGGIYLTLEEAGKILDLSPAWISLLENSKRPLSDEMVEAFAKLYKVKSHRVFRNLTVSKSEARRATA